MSVVTDSGRRTAWTQYLEGLADEVGLRDWHIIAPAWVPNDEDSGSCKLAFGRRNAMICVQPGLGEVEARHVAVHELVHVHLGPAIDQVRDDLSEFLGDPAHAAFWAGFNRAFEFAVDGIATALAKHLPLPSGKALGALK